MPTSMIDMTRLDEVLLLAYAAGSLAGFKVRRLRTRLKDPDAWRTMLGSVRELHRAGFVEPMSRAGGAFWTWTDKGRDRLHSLGAIAPPKDE